MRTSPLNGLLIGILLLSFFYAARADPVPPSSQSRNIILYAHYDETLSAVDKKTLTTYIPMKAAGQDNATVENVFTLYPPLGSDLEIDGTITFRAYLQADQVVNGRLLYVLFEVLPNGNRTVITKIEGYSAVTTVTDAYTFGVAGVKRQVKSGSTIQLSIHFAPEKPDAKVHLLFDGTKAPTQVVLPVVNHIKSAISASDTFSKIRNFFSLDETARVVNVTLKANITNPFGLDDIKAVNISALNEKGAPLFQEKIMALKSVGAGRYLGLYEYNATLPRGIFNIVVKVIDSSGTSHIFQESIGASYFNHVYITVTDGEGVPVPNREYAITNERLRFEVAGSTNASGVSEAVLPSSDVAGEYSIEIKWGNCSFRIPFSISLKQGETVDLKLPIYNLRIKILFYFIPLASAQVTLSRGATWIANGTTDWDGAILFNQIPSDRYNATVEYAYQTYRQEIDLKRPQEVLVYVRNRYMAAGLGLAFIFLLGSVSAVIVKNRGKPKRHSFSFIDRIIEGGLPYEASILISGPPASGKSVLVGNMTNESLHKGRKCVYIVNVDFPSKIREDLENLNVDLKKHEKENRILFLDCYSGVAGRESSELHHVDSSSDLTRIGIELSLCLEESGHKTDVYFDSMSTILATLRPEQIVSFLHTTAAKVKGFSGRFCFTTGSEAGKEILYKMDEASDCVIELTIRREGQAEEKALRVKKVRGKAHYSQWIPFKIEKGKGIVFYAPRRIFRKSYL